MDNPQLGLIWIAIVLVFGGAILRGKGTRIAIWIGGNKHKLDTPATVFRWSVVAVAAVMIWLGWQLPFHHAIWDIFLVVGGSALVIMFAYIPDLAFYCSGGSSRVKSAKETIDQ